MFQLLHVPQKDEIQKEQEGGGCTLCCAASRAASPPWLCPGRVSSKGGFGSAENRQP